MSKRKTAPPLNAGKPGITKLTCWRCEKPIAGAKVVIEGKYHCPDCCYLHDYPDRAPTAAPTRRRASAQAETLFTPPPPTGRNHDD